MTICAASGELLDGAGWTVEGLDGVYCDAHSATADYWQSLKNALGADHPLLARLKPTLDEVMAGPCPKRPPIDVDDLAAFSPWRATT